MSKISPPLTKPPVLHALSRAAQNATAEKKGGAFDQHLKTAQGRPSSEPARVPAATESSPSHPDDQAAQALHKQSTCNLSPRSGASDAEVAAPSPPGSSAVFAASSHTADADAELDTAADATHPSDLSAAAGLLALLGAATSGQSMAAGHSGVPGSQFSPAESAGGGAVLDASGSALGFLPAQAGAAPHLPEGEGQTLAAQTSMPGVPDPTMAPPGANANDPLAALEQPVALPSPLVNAAPAIGQGLPLASPAGGRAFQQALGQQVVWLTGQEIKQASIRLHPRDLGQLEIKVSVNQGNVTVVFHAQHAAAAEAVQQTLPQLATMLAQHGLALGHAEVGHRPPAHTKQHDSPRERAHPDTPSPEDSTAAIASSPSIMTANLLDAFA